MANVKKAIDNGQTDESLLEKLRSKPMRAPTILVVVASIQPHEKVPEVEQLLSAGASAQMMMVAAHAQGIGAIWRSGSLMFRQEMRDGLGLANNDQIIGFLYLGKKKAEKPVPEHNPTNFLHVWRG
jgi:nitroreductase